MRRWNFYRVVIILFLFQASNLGFALWKFAPSSHAAMILAGLILLPQLALSFLLLRHFGRRDYQSEDTNELNAWKGQLLGNLPCAVFAKDVDDDFRYVFANERFRDLMKINHGEVLGKNNRMVWGAVAEEMQAEDEELVLRGGMMERTRELTDSKGFRHYVRYSKALLLVNGRRLLVGVCSDVTKTEEDKLQTDEMQGILQETVGVAGFQEGGAVLARHGDEHAASGAAGYPQGMRFGNAGEGAREVLIVANRNGAL